MGSRAISQKRGYGPSCYHCRKNGGRCDPSEFDLRTCANCHEAKLECSLAGSRITPSREAKRKVEEIGDTPESEFIRSDREISSATAPDNSLDATIVPAQKKSRNGNQAQSKSLKPKPLAKNKGNTSINDACGICLQNTCDTGERKGDAEMLLCEIEGCATWYHLSCLLFRRKTKQIFYSFHTTTKKATFICPNCYNPERDDLADAVEKAESDFKAAMGRISQIISDEKEGRSEALIPTLPQEEQNTQTPEHTIQSVEMDGPRSMYFERAREGKFEGFEPEKVNALLREIGEAIYDYDREICYAKELFHDGNDISIEQPLKAWDQIDPGQHFLSGKEWFNVDGKANNLSRSHTPITAALRRMLGIPDDKPLHISTDLAEISFSQVHTAMINWFVFDILDKKINLYLFPNMKPLRAMMAAVVNFGDARWDRRGREVLREVQLRAWHKQQFREEVVENVSWQGELIRHLDDFLHPLTKKIGNINPWSPNRASIIKHTIELWTYLEAAVGKLDVIEPRIGGPFDGRNCENIDGDVQTGRSNEAEIRWVVRRGFMFREDSLGETVRQLKQKALVVVK